MTLKPCFHLHRKAQLKKEHQGFDIPSEAKVLYGFVLEVWVCSVRHGFPRVEKETWLTLGGLNFEMADNEISKEEEHVDMHDDDANDEVWTSQP